jgi:hypothetical protein
MVGEQVRGMREELKEGWGRELIFLLQSMSS